MIQALDFERQIFLQLYHEWRAGKEIGKQQAEKTVPVGTIHCPYVRCRPPV
jgi:hypothetical protein